MDKTFEEFASSVMAQYDTAGPKNSAEEFAFSLQNKIVKDVLNILGQYHKEYIEKN